MGSNISCVATVDVRPTSGKGCPTDLSDQLHHTPGLLSSVPLLSLHNSTVLHAACKKKQTQVVRQLLSFLSSAPLPTVLEALQPYCRRAGLDPPASHQEAVRMAVNMTNAKGQTPLMFACRANSPELVQLLLQQGADPWLSDRCGCRTALHYAALAGHVACVEALLRECPQQHAERGGARYIDCRSMSGLTPLHFAIFYGHHEAVDALLAHNPLTTAATTSESAELSGCVTSCAGSTPLHLAAARGRMDIARALLTFHAQRMHGNGSGNGRRHDPRRLKDVRGRLPLELAALHHPQQRELARLLHPANCVLRVLGMQVGDAAGGEWRLGPASLAAIAASALRGRLLAQLEAVTQQHPSGPSQRRRGAAKQHCDLGGGKGGAWDGASAGDSTQLSDSRPPSSALDVSGLLFVGPLGSARGEAVAPSTLYRGRCGSSALDQADGSLSSSTSTMTGAWACDSRPCSSMFAIQRVEEAEEGQEEQTEQQEAAADDDDGDDEGVCDVCCSARVAVAPSGCRHGLCGGCAAQMARRVTRKPLLCPFCRQVVSGFVPVAA